jgi:hypothetical protein
MYFSEMDLPVSQRNSRSKSKRNTVMMLPSKFQHSMRQFDPNDQGSRTEITPSCADYKIERVIGKQSIA